MQECDHLGTFRLLFLLTKAYFAAAASLSIQELELPQPNGSVSLQRLYCLDFESLSVQMFTIRTSQLTHSRCTEECHIHTKVLVFSKKFDNDVTKLPKEDPEGL